MNKINHICVATILLMALAVPGQAQRKIEAARLFIDHMVLQREMPVPVWGTAEPGAQVTVKFATQQKTATADAGGQWMVKFDALKIAAQPSDMVIAGADGVDAAKFTDVLVGDVYFCSGQSNMAMTMSDFESTADDRAKADFPKIRHFRQGEGAGKGQGWLVCSAQASAAFSATGFYFARKVHQQTGVPIGLISNAIGSSRIERWIPPEGYDLIPGLLDENGKVRQRPSDRYSMNHNANAKPLIPFAIKGMLWYQGEHNTWNWDNEKNYFDKMAGLIGGLRRAWNQGDFPVYFVQLPGLGQPNPNPAAEGPWTRVRMAQLKSLSIPNTGMAITIDAPATSIHPDNKRDVGERLALWALAKDYGQKTLEYSGPIYTSMKIEGAKVRLAFAHAGKGLTVGKRDGTAPVQEVPGGKLQGFAIAGVDTNAPAGKRVLKWVWADAAIEGDTVVVSSPEVGQPVAVRYAYSENPAGCNLYNKSGLPASPFRTE